MTTDEWISPESAWLRLAEHCSPLESENVDRRSALGQVLAEPLAATVDIPPADVSAMDGFAVSGEVAAGDCLPISGIIPAGASPDCELASGSAMRIMTGAPMPKGTDTVIAREFSEKTETGVRIDATNTTGQNVRAAAPCWA